MVNSAQEYSNEAHSAECVMLKQTVHILTFVPEEVNMGFKEDPIL